MLKISDSDNFQFLQKVAKTDSDKIQFRQSPLSQNLSPEFAITS